jgi:thymidylate kinase
MDKKLFDRLAGEVLDRFDPGRERKRPATRPFMVELTGMSNAGKTTLMDRLYVAFKAAGYEVAKIPEGAEAIPPPRDLPFYNFHTATYALERALVMRTNRNIHLALFDRARLDFMVRLEMFAADGTMTTEDARTAQAFYDLPQVRDLFDLNILLMCDPDVALARKYGPDHAERAARGELKYSTTTNPKTMRQAFDAHQRVWNRSNGSNDPKIVWHDTSNETQDQTAELVRGLLIRAFERRLATP